MRNIRIGIPSKGRLSELAIDLLKQAGLNFRRQNRSLFAKISGLDAEVTFLRTDDIPVLCGEGAIDLGITGSDNVYESRPDLDVRLPLGVGKCRLSVCIPDDSKITSVEELDACRIATSFPNLTKEFLAESGANARTVELSGSVEIMVSLGVADAIVDLVETGSTLASNRLKILTDIGHYETVLIQSPTCVDTNLADRVVRRLEGVVIARSYSLLEYNIPRTKLAKAEEITPGFKSPTVNSLEDPNWCAVRAMVKQKEVIDAMEELEALGASAILETRINNTRL